MYYFLFQDIFRSCANSELNKKKNNTTNSTNKPANDIVSTALSGNVNKLNIDNNTAKKPLPTLPTSNKCHNSSNVTENQLDQADDDSAHSFEHSDCSSTATLHSKDVVEGGRRKTGKKLMRRKRNGGSIEDPWEEASVEDSAKNNSNIQNGPTHNNSEHLSSVLNTRTIKISYGPQGEGTVLKIPAQIDNLVDDESEENVNVDDVSKNKVKDENDKAVRKAMKKAKREARKKYMFSGPSPTYIGNSPRYPINGSSSRYTGGTASPRHNFGSISPRYMIGTTSCELSVPRRRKHKMKHKKKHRDEKDRKHKESEVGIILFRKFLICFHIFKLMLCI